MGIYDIHNHTLYGVDDGSKSLEMSMNMIDIAYKEGIRGIIFTPHFNRRIWEVDKSVLYERFDKLKEAVAAKYPDMKLYLGNEIYYCQNTEEDVSCERMVPMAGSRYVLVEFDTSASFRTIKNAVTQVMQWDYIPILAHVERYECLLSKPALVDELVDKGAYIQVNARTIDGENGRLAKSMVKKLLKRYMVHFVATDAHRDEGRAPYISASRAYIAKKYGEDYARYIYEENPECIIRNEYIEEF